MSNNEAVTSQPKSRTINVEVPNIDVDHLIQGNWEAKVTDCFEDIPVCRSNL